MRLDKFLDFSLSIVLREFLENEKVDDHAVHNFMKVITMRVTLAVALRNAI